MNAAMNTSETNASINANHNCSIKGCSVDHKTLAFFLSPEIERVKGYQDHEDDASEDMAYDKEGKAASRVEDQTLNCGSISCRSSSRRSFTFPVLSSEVRMVKANRRCQWWKTCICFGKASHFHDEMSTLGVLTLSQRSDLWCAQRSGYLNGLWFSEGVQPRYSAASGSLSTVHLSKRDQLIGLGRSCKVSSQRSEVSSSGMASAGLALAVSCKTEHTPLRFRGYGFQLQRPQRFGSATCVSL
ncbi:hypothetical protein Tco_0309282 [Tanacetum coccineum]